jgi:hypothetical protein
MEFGKKTVKNHLVHFGVKSLTFWFDVGNSWTLFELEYSSMEGYEVYENRFSVGFTISNTGYFEELDVTLISL